MTCAASKSQKHHDILNVVLGLVASASELVRVSPTPDVLHQSLKFNKMPKIFTFILKFGKNHLEDSRTTNGRNQGP